MPAVVPLLLLLLLLRTREALPGLLRTEWPICELGGSYLIPHHDYCDRFFTCQYGLTYLGQCEDGFGFVIFQGCLPLHLVKCGKRTKLQVPKGRGDCPRLYGLYSHPLGCGNYLRCLNGTASTLVCPLGFMFDTELRGCRPPRPLEKEKCFPSKENGQDLKCPRNTHYLFGDDSRHPYKGNSTLFVICLIDGSVKIGECDIGTVFSEDSRKCEPISGAPNCAQHTMLSTDSHVRANASSKHSCPLD